MSVQSSSFSLEDGFEVSVECEVYVMGDVYESGEDGMNALVDGEFVGWVSVSSDEVELSDEEVVEMLDDAHVVSELACDVIEACVPRRHLRACGVKRGHRLEVEDVWVDGFVTRDVLESVRAEVDNGERIVEAVEELADEIRVVEESVE